MTMKGGIMREGDIWFREFVKVNHKIYMLDMRWTPDAGTECMAFRCSRRGEPFYRYDVCQKNGMNLTRREFEKCKKEFIANILSEGESKW